MDVVEVRESEILCTETGDATLISVIESGGDDEALKLLSSGQTFSQDDLNSALITACYCGYKFLVYELVRLGADAQTTDKNGNTPFLICAEQGFTNMVRFFIRQQADINSENLYGNTALILAIGRSGSVEMVKLLLAQEGINISHQNKDGYTVLMKAVEVMDFHVIKLFNKQRYAKQLGKIKNCRNETAQNIAERLGIGTVVKLLAEHGSQSLTEAVRTCDVDSFNILRNCQLYDSSKMCEIVNDAFQTIIRKHAQNNETFSASEEKIIQRLLECGANTDHNYSVFPVFTASKVGSYRVLQLLLEHITNFDSSVTSKFMDPFKAAAENGHTDIIQLLLKYSDVSKLDYSHLECALKNGHTECARFLVKQGVSLDVKTVLRFAIVSQNPIYVKCLTEIFETEVRHLAHTRDMDNFLVTASACGNVEIIGLLLDAGANVNCVSDNKRPLMVSKNAEVVHFLVQRGAVVNRYSRAKQDYTSPLTYILSHRCSEKIVEALLKCGAHVNAKSCGGRTPLMIALSNQRHRNIVQMLLNYGADYKTSDSKGNTSLLQAVIANKTDNILCLLQFSKFNQDILNTQNYDEVTALIVAAKNCNLEAVRHLVDQGADVNITDGSGNTALLHAVANAADKDGEILTTLISAGSNINHQNSEGLSPLMLAARECKPNTIKLLVQSGADVNSVSRTNASMTAISCLSIMSYLWRERLICMTYLLDQGARASYVSPDIIHKLILQNSVRLIPKLIQCGLGPSEVSSSNIADYSVGAYNSSVMSLVSPLSVALITKNVSLARYFIGNLFMTKLDTCRLVSNQALRQHLKDTDCLALLDELSAQPMSLFTLAFVAVQSAIGFTPGREERINSLPLPQLTKDRLLFKREEVPLDVTPTDPSIDVSFMSRFHTF